MLSARKKIVFLQFLWSLKDAQLSQSILRNLIVIHSKRQMSIKKYKVILVSSDYFLNFFKNWIQNLFHYTIHITCMWLVCVIVVLYSIWRNFFLWDARIKQPHYMIVLCQFLFFWKSNYLLCFQDNLDLINK